MKKKKKKNKAKWKIVGALLRQNKLTHPSLV
jgi:hypothetical protein